MDELPEHTKRLAGVLMEHPVASAAVRKIAEEFEEQIEMSLIEQTHIDEWERIFGDEPYPCEVGDILIRHQSSKMAIAVIKMEDDSVVRLDRE